MKITKLSINNFRNLDRVKFTLDENCNFLVGENNLGKSNILSLLNILFNFRSFKQEEFFNPLTPIEIQFTLRLSDIEIGHFSDLFDSDDYTLINISAIQSEPDEIIEFSHLESGTYIPVINIKSLNFIYYDSIRSPITEVNFDKGKGVGKFLQSIISSFLLENQFIEKDFLVEQKINDLISYINNSLKKLKPFNDFRIESFVDDNIESILSKVIVLKENDGKNLTKTGYGVQFSILILLSILEKIQSILSQRKGRSFFIDPDTNQKSITLIIGLDEPEIHLHPYMQRALIKYLSSIMNGENRNFNLLIKEIFDLDLIHGQLIIVTHSPNIISNNYKHITRIYQDHGRKKLISGTDIHFAEIDKKRLYLHFPFIKEAFFSRCVIFVEGDTEYAALPEFAQTININLDDLGICIFQVRGDAILQLMKVVSEFGISSVGITDKDDGNKNSAPNLFITSSRDFEEELVSIIDRDEEPKLRSILTNYDSKGEERELTVEAINKYAHKKYKLQPSPYQETLVLKNINPTDKLKFKAYYLTWFGINKSIVLGRLIGESLEERHIPLVYKEALLEAKRICPAE